MNTGMSAFSAASEKLDESDLEKTVAQSAWVYQPSKSGRLLYGMLKA